jgi:hypothetical protein
VKLKPKSASASAIIRGCASIIPEDYRRTGNALTLTPTERDTAPSGREGNPGRSNGQCFRIFDPLTNEWVAPYPAAQPMTRIDAEAAIFDCEAAAVMRGRQLIGPRRPWLVMQPVCPQCVGIA